MKKSHASKFPSSQVHPRLLDEQQVHQVRGGDATSTTPVPTTNGLPGGLLTEDEVKAHIIIEG